MTIKKLISQELPILSLQTNGERGLILMQEFKVSHLPIIHRDDYIALVSEDDILDWDTPEKELSHAEFLEFRPVVFEHFHPYEAISLMEELQVSVLPVLDKNQKFMGCITLENLFHYLGKTNAIKSLGAILVLKIENIHYSLSEISRIAESNNISILSVQLNTEENSNFTLVTLKTNRTDLQGLIASFERYDYVVEEVFGATNIDSNDVQQNYVSLINYINI